MTETADNPASENAKKQLAAQKTATEASRKEYEEIAKGKPTPTQEENDLAALGAHIIKHEEDGSPEEGENIGTQKEAKPAASSGGYATRASTPARPPARSSE